MVRGGLLAFSRTVMDVPVVAATRFERRFTTSNMPFRMIQGRKVLNLWLKAREVADVWRKMCNFATQSVRN